MKKRTNKRPPKVAFVALGCAKNLVDSESMLGRLGQAGAVLTPDAADADVIVINTCGFLAAARDEAHEAIREAVEHKRTGRCRRVVVAGCLVQRDGERLLADVPGIDAVVGVHRRDDLVAATLPSEIVDGRPARLGKKAGDRRKSRGCTLRAPNLYLGDYHPHVLIDSARLRLTPSAYAYLRISEGCNQKCTFCTIPAIRGPMHCKPPEVILNEARELIDDGARELVLIGQDTTSYGEDVGYAPGLAGLLRQLDCVEGVGWIRLMYAYPSVFTDAMIDAIAECEHVVPYIDIPLQHINDRILRAMYRRVTRRHTQRLIARIREGIPGVHLRTTLIAGFPGETDAEFAELLEFVRQVRFDALGVFPYSLEPDTPAGRMDGQIPERIKQERTEAIMLAQQAIAFERAREHVERTFDVLIERPESEGRFVARHPGQAPEVDSVTYVEADALTPGTFVRVRCHAACDYDLLARPVNLRSLSTVGP